MEARRVVITGLGAISPFGPGCACLWENLCQGNSAVRKVPKARDVIGLRSHVAAIVPEIDISVIPRKKRRFMSTMSIYSYLASQEAIQHSGNSEEIFESRRTGLALASTTGSSEESEAFFKSYNVANSIESVKSTMFFKTMNHSCAANTSQALGIRGRLLSPSAACASGTLAIGLAFETIMAGQQDVMLCGGSDEYHVLSTAVFDIMNAASLGYNDCPDQTPRPFDQNRDGVVCAEGSGIVLLEELEHARSRGAVILAEILGFSTLSSPDDIANPDKETISTCMTNALEQASLKPDDIDYVSAHATATDSGDIVESQAIFAVVGKDVPVSSLKGHIGHTMAASGPLELIASLKMMQHGVL
ncbi:MAG: beta-ketoacyl-[acyl-carrier-protein] synthase family protein, partial [Sedimentisphaerales bacterium]|nr:beta-ketoacyl-[acyl-carrier-protein] synthase family protein [Sedimentisphaerales bacterium]